MYFVVFCRTALGRRHGDYFSALGIFCPTVIQSHVKKNRPEVMSRRSFFVKYNWYQILNFFPFVYSIISRHKKVERGRDEKQSSFGYFRGFDYRRDSSMDSVSIIDSIHNNDRGATVRSATGIY